MTGSADLEFMQARGEGSPNIMKQLWSMRYLRFSDLKASMRSNFASSVISESRSRPERTIANPIPIPPEPARTARRAGCK
jgi:hypothetical protein